MLEQRISGLKKTITRDEMDVGAWAALARAMVRSGERWPEVTSHHDIYPEIWRTIPHERSLEVFLPDLYGLTAVDPDPVGKHWEALHDTSYDSKSGFPLEVKDEHGMHFRYIAAGNVWIEDETRSASVPSYYIGKYPVTVADYEIVQDQIPPEWERQRSRPKRPVAFVPYTQAHTFACSRKARLPTKSEWLRAARGSGPKGICNLYVISGHAVLQTLADSQWDNELQEVNDYAPSDWGVHCMLGWVSEYASHPDGNLGMGCSWADLRDRAQVQAAIRVHRANTEGYAYFGFRLVKDIQELV